MIGAIIIIIPIIVGTSYLAEHTTLWLTLLALNAPVYWIVANTLYSNTDELLWSIENIFGDGDDSEDGLFAGLYGWFYLGGCLAVVTAQYKLLSWLLY